ncbi:hypothetical protein DTO027I6_9819 [Penicillium roqueforti]|nr:hypothetical protein CBS147337_9888 [Penicillium roqueforti]KAI3185303.1 hypothetical protein DTO027I6_9819 [Penicillium roqueforti]
MSDHSSNGGPHHSKLANKLDPRVDSDRGNQNAPDIHLGYAHNYGKGGRHNKGIANMLDPRVNSDQDNRHRENVAASTTFMPQAGKPAGIRIPEADKPDQRVDSDPDNRRRENVAGSNHFIPQAGKHTGKSSL